MQGAIRHKLSTYTTKHHHNRSNGDKPKHIKLTVIDTRTSTTKPKPISTNKLTLSIIKREIRKSRYGGMLKLTEAVRLCEEELGKKLRFDYIVCSLMGKKGFYVDCREYTIYYDEEPI